MADDKPSIDTELQPHSQEFWTSSVFTIPSSATKTLALGCGGGGGGGGAGVGIGSEGGLSGGASPLVGTRSLVPGKPYVVLLGAAGLGGTTATRIEDHGGGGTDGGYTAIVDDDSFVQVMVPQHAETSFEKLTADLPRLPLTVDPVPPPSPPRFAIVDPSHGVVDNVVFADDGFFDDAFVIRAALERRIVDADGELSLILRPQGAIPVRLRDGERVAPGWRVVSLDESRERFIPSGESPNQSALRGGAGGRGGASRGHAIDLHRERLRILAIATEWRSRHGGVSTMNRELCIALAAAHHEVVCVVPAPLEKADRESAAKGGVTLIEAAPTRGKKLAAESGLLRRLPLPQGFAPDVLLGHGHVTGRAALYQIEDWFPYSRRVHVVHTQPGEIEWQKESDRSAISRVDTDERFEAELTSSADVAVGIGPRLAREASRFLSAARKTQRVFELTPALNGDSQDPEIPVPIEALIVGRMEDSHLKGLDLALETVKLLREEMSIVLTIRGVDPSSADSVRKNVVDHMGEDNAVRIYPFSVDEGAIEGDMLRSSVVLMPSRTEGFGLVGWEAIGLAIPVLVSSESGLAELLMREVPHLAKECVVSMKGSDVERVRRWASSLKTAASDRTGAFARARALRSALRARLPSWSAIAARLVQQVRDVGTVI